MGHIGDGVAVKLFAGAQFVVKRFHAGENLGVLFHVCFQLFEVAAVELHQTTTSRTFKNQFNVAGAHGQERQQRQTGTEINRREAFFRIVVMDIQFQAVGLTLTGGPFVLTREFVSAHLLQQLDEARHEFFLGAVLGGTQFGMVNRLAFEKPFQQIEAVVHFQAPCAAFHPVGNLAAASQGIVHESGVDIVDRGFVAEMDAGAFTNQFPPQRTGPRSGGVNLQLKDSASTAARPGTHPGRAGRFLYYIPHQGDEEQRDDITIIGLKLNCDKTDIQPGNGWDRRDPAKPTRRIIKDRRKHPHRRKSSG